MIKEEQVPIQWRKESVLYCDNCGEVMRLDHERTSLYDTSWYYECPKCDLRLISPRRLDGVLSV